MKPLIASVSTHPSSYAAAAVAFCAGMAGLGGMPSSSFAANLVDNGDFANVKNAFVENVSLGADDLLTGGGSNIPGWSNITPPGAPAHYANEMWIQPDNEFDVSASPNNGSGYFVDLTGEANDKPYGGLKQAIKTSPGTGYTLTFALGASTLYNTSGSGAAALTASASGTDELVSKHFSLTPSSSNEWKTETLTFIADSDKTTIAFLADSNNTSRYVGLDDVVMTTRLLPTTAHLTSSTQNASAGSSVSLTTLVKPAEGNVTPTGKVTFKSGTQSLGSVTLNGTGQATFATTSLPIGHDEITALYSGDDIHSSSTSAVVAVTITAGKTVIDLSATSLAFGNQPAGTSSAAKKLTISNVGSGTVTLTSIEVEGGQADDFVLSKACGKSLAPKAACTVSITFKAVSTGKKTSTLSISDNAGGSPQKVALSGTGT